MDNASNFLKCCRVCGLMHEDFFPWGENADTPSFGICDCCGTEFGLDDSTHEATKRARASWIEGGCLWFYKKAKPVAWSADEQLANILAPQQIAACRLS